DPPQEADLTRLPRRGWSGQRACAFAARALGDRTSRTLRRRSFEPCFARLALLRVDLRDGRSCAESSRVAVALGATFFVLRRAVEPPPAFRCVALCPGAAVSTGTSCRILPGRASASARFCVLRPTRRPMRLPSGEG